MSKLHTVEVAAPEPSNAIRSHDHPMLESGNLSFPKGPLPSGIPTKRGPIVVCNQAPD